MTGDIIVNLVAACEQKKLENGVTMTEELASYFSGHPTLMLALIDQMASAAQHNDTQAALLVATKTRVEKQMQALLGKEEKDKEWLEKLEKVMPLISNDEQEGLLQRASRQEQESVVDALIKTPTIKVRAATTPKTPKPSNVSAAQAAFSTLAKKTRMTAKHCSTFSKLQDNLQSADFWKKATDVLVSFFNTFGSPDRMQQPHLSNVEFMSVTAQLSCPELS